MIEVRVTKGDRYLLLQQVSASGKSGLPFARLTGRGIYAANREIDDGNVALDKSNPSGWRLRLTAAGERLLERERKE